MAIALAGVTPSVAHAATTRQVTFVVRTSDGRPVTGAWVSWSANDGSASSGAQKQTDAAGRVTYLAVPLVPVSFQVYDVARIIPSAGEAIGGQVAGSGTLRDFHVSSLDIPASGDVVVDVGPAPGVTRQPVVVQMPDGTPVPGAVLQAKGAPGSLTNDAPWLATPVRSSGADGSNWTACPSDPACYYQIYDHATGAAAYRMTTDANGSASLWRFTQPQGPADSTCPFSATFNDGELAQNAAFDCVSAGRIVVQLPYMPVVRIEQAPGPVAAGQPAQLTVQAVDGSGQPIKGVTVSMSQVGATAGGGAVPAHAAARASAAAKHSESCKSQASGATGIDGRATLVVCPQGTATWQADGPSLVPSRAVTIPVSPSGPSGLQVVPRNGSAKLSWSPASGLAAGQLTGYQVTAKGTKGCTTTKTTCTVKGLKTGHRYAFTVRATTTGASVPTAEVSAVAGAPSAPQKVTVTAVPGGVTIRWRRPASTGGATITTYVAKAGSRTCRTSGATSCLVRGVSKRKPVRVTVTAQNSRGTGLASDPVDYPAPKR